MIGRWVPTAILAFGSLLTLTAARQQALPLRLSMHEVIPLDLVGFRGQDLAVSDLEAEVAGFSNYLFRVYELAVQDSTLSPSPPDSIARDESPAQTQVQDLPWFSLYVGYYESQARGNTIHSPKNCLPGAGWEPLSSEPVRLDLPDRTVTLNRYILQNGADRAVALYWYQGRGRVAHNEYGVKLDLLRDAALRRRSDEALVRVVVPLPVNEEEALELAERVAYHVIPALDGALPAG